MRGNNVEQCAKVYKNYWKASMRLKQCNGRCQWSDFESDREIVERNYSRNENKGSKIKKKKKEKKLIRAYLEIIRKEIREV